MEFGDAITRTPGDNDIAVGKDDCVRRATFHALEEKLLSSFGIYFKLFKFALPSQICQ